MLLLIQFCYFSELVNFHHCIHHPYLLFFIQSIQVIINFSKRIIYRIIKAVFCFIWIMRTIKYWFYPVVYFVKSDGWIGSCLLIILLLSRFVIGSFFGANIADDFIFLFFVVIHISGVTLTPVTDKRETSVGILDSNYISVYDGGSNLIVKLDVLVTFCVLVDYLNIFSFSEIGATKFSFFSISSLGDYKSLIASSRSKSYLAFFLNSWCYWIITCLNI